MEIRPLQYLLMIAEEGSFTKAARKLYVTQSALSQQIQTLEKNLDTILLDRSKRGVRLTAAGEILCHHTRRILHEMAQAEIAIQELEGVMRGDLRVGVVQTVNSYLIPDIVMAFTARYPDIKLFIEELSSDEIEDRLKAGTLQVGLSFIPLSDEKITCTPLFIEELMLIVRDDHPLALKERIAVQQLDGLPLVMLSNTFCTRRLWEENARLVSITPQVVMEMNTVSSILAVVEKSGLAGILPGLTLTESDRDHIKSIILYNPTPSREVGILWHRDSYLCQASQAFIKAVQQVSAVYAI